VVYTDVSMLEQTDTQLFDKFTIHRLYGLGIHDGVQTIVFRQYRVCTAMLCLRSEDAFVITCVANHVEVKSLVRPTGSAV
jgi:hypothetical protein